MVSSEERAGGVFQISRRGRDSRWAALTVRQRERLCAYKPLESIKEGRLASVELKDRLIGVANQYAVNRGVLQEPEDAPAEEIAGILKFVDDQEREASGDLARTKLPKG